MTQAPERYVGGGVPRKEDPALVTGRATWTDNIRLPGTVHMAVLRSPFAHARITNLDVSPAREMPGVVAAFTGRDLADEWAAPLPCGWQVTEDLRIPDHWPLARDKVRYVGDAVAVVLATDRYRARDALEAIQVDYEPLDAVVDVEAALKEGSPLVHEELGTNECYTWPLEVGDVEEAFERADVVVKERYIQQRLIPNAIEP
ncbi:xanthine dehydrogenase family protein molybdopterin-binding subunit, partial [Rubrobacter taiwanensis]